MVTMTREITAARGPALGGEAHRRPGPTLVVAGLLCVAVAMVGVVWPGNDRSPAAAPPPASVAASPIEGSILNVQTAVYEPDQSSGWHRHEGTHVVAVVSGTLTVYDEDCGMRTYGDGDAYVGGRSAHLARNEGDQPVRMVVTYVVDRGRSVEGSTLTLRTPGACRPS